MKEKIRTMKIRVAELIVLEASKRQVRGLRKPDEAKRQTEEMSEAKDQALKIRACDVMQGTLEGGGVEEKSEQDV